MHISIRLCSYFQNIEDHDTVLDVNSKIVDVGVAIITIVHLESTKQTTRWIWSHLSRSVSVLLSPFLRLHRESREPSSHTCTQGWSLSYFLRQYEPPVSVIKENCSVKCADEFHKITVKDLSTFDDIAITKEI